MRQEKWSGAEDRLWKAIEQGDGEEVTRALAAGANVNAVDADGSTFLGDVVLHGFEPFIALLIDRGADVNKGDAQGMTPLHVASMLPDELSMAQLLIGKGADPNAKDENGNTPLHIAADFGELDVIKLLIEKGADPHLQNAAGQTAGQVADAAVERDLRAARGTDSAGHAATLAQRRKSTDDLPPH